MLPLAISAANNVIVTFTPPPGSSMIILNNVSYPLVNGSAQFNGGSILPGGSITITYQVIGASGLMTVSVSTSTYNANSMTSLTVNV
jgi:cobalamin-dependent methionine synthase I